MLQFIERLLRLGEQRSRGIERVFLESGLFLRDWYLRAYPDVAKSGRDPGEHFLSDGWREGRRPNPLLDGAWYLRQYPDVAQANVNPVVHYWRYGESENRRPSPLFDPRWYRQQYANEIGPEGALAHYLRNRHLRRHSPNPLFDVRYYVRMNPDVAAGDLDPYEHFLTAGCRDGRNPSAGFDVHRYVERYLQQDSKDPITHYYEASHDETGAAAAFVAPPQGILSPASEIRRFTAQSPDFEEIDPQIAAGRPRLAKIFAFYLPQFHQIPENDEWWGRGFTEWTNVCRGTPRFAGHYQPRVPRDLGFYDLSDPRVLPCQVAAASAAGIHGFCFHYYNFGGRRLLERPLEDFLARPEIDFPFCLAWANENWTRRWDGATTSMLMEQSYRTEDIARMVDDIARYFRDPRYFRVAGRPLLIVYRTDVIPDVSEMVRTLRARFAARHGEEPWLLMAESFYSRDPAKPGLDGAVEFPPHGFAGERLARDNLTLFDHQFTAQVYRYDDLADAARQREAPGHSLIRAVLPSWDNDARRQGRGLTLVGSTPRKYAAWLADAIAFANAHPFHGERIVFINAWNEWAEGAYLEPDIHFGGAYLNATARAVTGTATALARRKMLFIGHDAFYSGAQLLLLALVRTFARQFGFEASVFLCDDGELLGAYRDLAPTDIRVAGRAREDDIARLAREGYDRAIVNSAASGALVPPLKNAGFKILCLVHEMPGIIAQKGLDAPARAVAERADEVLFPAAVVRDAFEGAVGPVRGTASVRPQGMYQPPSPVAGARESLSAELGLPASTRFVVNIAYGDWRKGVDLFCEVARLVAKHSPDAVFLWVGELDPGIQSWIAGHEQPPNVRFIGRRDDISRLLSAADLFALTSREDPFPSIVLEALALGVPVIGFRDAGGFADLLQSGESGELVPHGDTAAFGSAIARWLDKGRDGAGTNAAAGFAARFAFDEYAFDLARRLDPALRNVSVIVPNYNYGRHVGQRLASLFRQSYPLFEVLFLDDASTDDSIAMAKHAADAARRDITVLRSERNSGNVFAQWSKGVRAARGDLVWIAEADDLAAPDYLERMVRFFSDPAMAFAFSDSRAIGEDGEPLGPSYRDYYATLHPGALSADIVENGGTFASTYLSQKNVILNASAVLWRREHLAAVLAAEAERLRGYRLAGDWHLYLAACAMGGKAGYCAMPLNTHRRHQGSVTRSLPAQAHLEEIRKVHAYFNATFGANEERSRRQGEYVKELSAQFGL